MGACDISFEVDGKCSFSKVKDHFRDRRSLDAAENGHRDGYSGDFQTVHDIKDHSYKGVFSNYNSAMQYCLDNAKKWEYAVAVQYRELPRGYSNAKLQALELRLSKAKDARQAAGRAVADAIYKGKSKLLGCNGCGSKLARAKLNSVSCPLCATRLVSDSAEKRLARLDAKIQACQDALQAYRKTIAEKHGQVKWLIAGWGAC